MSGGQCWTRTRSGTWSSGRCSRSSTSASSDSRRTASSPSPTWYRPRAPRTKQQYQTVQKCPVPARAYKTAVRKSTNCHFLTSSYGSPCP
eukprot:3174814-Rhodomonas_salina.1